MADKTHIEWTDAKGRVNVPYGKQDRRHENRGEAVRVVLGGLHRTSFSQGKMVHSLQGMARSGLFWGGQFQNRWLNRPMPFGKECSQSNDVCNSTPPAARTTLCIGAERRPKASETTREFLGRIRSVATTRDSGMQRLRAHRTGGAS